MYVLSATVNFVPSLYETRGVLSVFYLFLQRNRVCAILYHIPYRNHVEQKDIHTRGKSIDNG